MCLILTLWLLVTVIQDDVCSMVDARSEVFHRAFAKLVDPEDKVVYIRDPINVVLKDIYAEWMEQTWGGKKGKINMGNVLMSHC